MRYALARSIAAALGLMSVGSAAVAGSCTWSAELGLWQCPDVPDEPIDWGSNPCDVPGGCYGNESDPPDPGTWDDDIEIRYVMFIPLDHVQNPLGLDDSEGFTGDNVSRYTPGYFRIRVRAWLKMSTGELTQPPWVASGVTKLFNLDESLVVGQCISPSPALRWEGVFFGPLWRPGQCLRHNVGLLETGRAAGLDTIAVSTSRVGDNIRISMQGAPYNSIAPGPDWVGPHKAIQWEHVLTLARDGSYVAWHLDAQHDGFPYHLIQLQDRTIYGHNPLDHGHTPYRLGGSLDVANVGSGRIKNVY